MSHPLDELIAEAELGKQAKDFLESELGRCLIGMAKQDADIAKEGLANVNPTDTEAVRKLQNKVQLGMQFEQWLRTLVANGDAAINVFKQQENE